MAPPSTPGALALLALLARVAPAAGQVNVCYFTNWARYRSGLINQGKDLFEMGVDGGLCTHFMYGFAKVDPSTFVLSSNDPNADHPSGSAAQAQLCPAACNDPAFKPDWNDPAGQRCDWPCSPSRVYRGYEGLTVGMKRKNSKIKALVSVGGWNFNDCAASSSATYGQGTATCEIFSTIASSEANVRSFAAKVIAFCRSWGFDGFDLDWEYPVVPGHNSNSKVGGSYVATPQDRANYVMMLRVMKEEFLKENAAAPLLLTAAVGVGKDTVDTAYDIPGMNQHLDLINLMTYDLHGAWESRTGCNANLYATEADTLLGGGVGAGTAVQGYPLSVSWAVDYWLQAGAAPGKLTMGLGTYGRGWKLASSNSSYNAPATGASTPGVSTKEAGYLAYYEVQELLRSGAATRYYDQQRQCPYVVTNTGEWIGYDDEQSLRAKLAFARSRGLAGTMVWALDLDDFAGAYSTVRYPLISLALQGSTSTVSPATSSPSTAPGATSTSTRATSAAATTTLRGSTSTSVEVAKTSTTAPMASSTPTSTAPGKASTTTPLSTKASSTSVVTTPLSQSTSTLRASTSRSAASAGCRRNTDCSANPWCSDAAYDSWCASVGAAGSCPAPQCTLKLA